MPPYWPRRPAAPSVTGLTWTAYPLTPTHKKRPRGDPGAYLYKAHHRKADSPRHDIKKQRWYAIYLCIDGCRRHNLSPGLPARKSSISLPSRGAGGTRARPDPTTCVYIQQTGPQGPQVRGAPPAAKQQPPPPALPATRAPRPRRPVRGWRRAARAAVPASRESVRAGGHRRLYQTAACAAAVARWPLRGPWRLSRPRQAPLSRRP